MSILKLTCPSCRRPLQPEQPPSVGMKLRCPGCGCPITLGAEEIARAKFAANKAAETRARPNRSVERAPAGGGFGAGLLVGALLVVLAGGGAGAYYYFKHVHNKNDERQA